MKKQLKLLKLDVKTGFQLLMALFYGMVVEIRDFFVEFFKVTVFIGDFKTKHFDASRIYATAIAVITIIVIVAKMKGNVNISDALVITCLGTMSLVLGALQYKSIQMEKNTGSNISQFPVNKVDSDISRVASILSEFAVAKDMLKNIVPTNSVQTLDSVQPVDGTGHIMEPLPSEKEAGSE